MTYRADPQFAAWKAAKVLAKLQLSKPPILPIEIASAEGIVVQGSDRIGAAFSGCLMKQGDTFGILYTTRLDNIGFIHFTVSHELGHYFMDHHREHFFSEGYGTHHSVSGFASYDPYETEADHFAAAFLMPEGMFVDAIRDAGEGIAAIEKLQAEFCTSLTATAIRYAQLSPDPVAVIVSEHNSVSYAFASDSLRDLQGFWLLGKGTTLPVHSTTADFNRNPENVRLARKLEGSSQLDDWFDRAPDIEVNEDVLGLGSYGKTLTVLFADELPDFEESDEDDT